MKTRKALHFGLLALLKRQRFSKISVHDICTESWVSRTAFYAHYKDKYDLLEQWLAEQRNYLRQLFQNDPAQEAEDNLCELLHLHSAVIMNLLEDANQEQRNLLFRFLSPDVDTICSQSDEVLAEFLAGGMFHLIDCQMRRYPKALEKERTRKIVEYAWKMVRVLLLWDSTHAE